MSVSKIYKQSCQTNDATTHFPMLVYFQLWRKLFKTLRNSLKSIHKFNEKYELIAEKVAVYRNLNSVLHFASALEKFKVKVRYLHNMCKELDNKDAKISSGLLNSTKISKILRELSDLSIKFDFSGVKSFEEQRAYIISIRASFFGIIER